MVKLTPELLQKPSYLSPLKDRELDLRGMKIPSIENLGILRNSVDSLDLTDNSIRSLTNFPVMSRLTQIIINNNPLNHINPHLGFNLVNLKHLSMMGCEFREFSQLLPLFALPSLQSLTLYGNPVKNAKYYREFLIFGCKKLRILDFQKVKDKERNTATDLFQVPSNPPAPTALYTSLTSSTTFTQPTAPTGTQKVDKGRLLTKEEKERVKRAVEAAGSAEEVQRLQRMLDQGLVPSEKDVVEMEKRKNGGKDREGDITMG
ncbi:L domain-like protein [Atractiella rhizophila]|nr:L domain-like protein [Atractiella rhizophila]